ncbi:tail protein, partial [Xanthomonas vasicola pv. vasculorum NCPPB 895]
GEIAFEADILANDAVDLSIKLPLTERVVVTTKDGGGYDMAHAPEPVIDPTWMS